MAIGATGFIGMYVCMSGSTESTSATTKASAALFGFMVPKNARRASITAHFISYYS